MRRLLSPVAVLLLLLVPAAAVAQDFDAEGEQAMLDRVNTLRAEHQLAPVARLAELDAVARGHSAEMARTGQLAHVSEATGTPEDRVRRSGVEAAAIAENVAFHHDTANAQQALIESPAHRSNMLSADVTHVGLASVRTERGVYVTQVFAGLTAPEPAIAEVAPPAPIEAAAEEPAPEAPSFALIPPFVERAAGAAADVVAGAPVVADSALAEDASADDAEPSAEVSADEASATEPRAATTAEAAPDAEAAPVDGPAVSGDDALTLRRLLGMAQSLLGASSAR